VEEKRKPSGVVQASCQQMEFHADGKLVERENVERILVPEIGGIEGHVSSGRLRRGAGLAANCACEWIIV